MANLAKTRAACLLDNPNPQPYKRVRNGKTWLFAHDGEIPVLVLRQLIGEEDLKASPPTTCFENGPKNWQDSELYFLFLLKKIEQKDGLVEEAIREGVKDLKNNLGEQQAPGLNFFLSDGEKIWAYRNGSPLFLSVQINPMMFMVASAPTGQPESWREIPDDVMLVLEKEAGPRVIVLSENPQR